MLYTLAKQHSRPLVVLPQKEFESPVRDHYLFERIDVKFANNTM